MQRFTTHLLTVCSILTCALMDDAASAACSSHQSGNWSAPATWEGARVPGPSEPVAIGHAVVVDGDASAGSSAAEVAAIMVTTGGSLTIAAGKTLVVRGDLTIDQASVRLEAGSFLAFDASQAAAPATTFFRLNLAGSLTATGTDAARCTIRSHPGGGCASILVPIGAVSTLDLRGCDVLRMGDAGHPAIRSIPNAPALSVYRLTRCRFDACGQIYVDSQGASGSTVISLHGVTCANSMDPTSCLVTCFSNSQPDLEHGAAYEIVDSVFDLPATLYCAQKAVITGNFFNENLGLTNTPMPRFDGNLVRNGVHRDLNWYGDITNSYVLHDHTVPNPHSLSLRGGRDQLVDGVIFEYSGTDGQGDMVIPDAAQQPTTATIRHCIVLPNSGGQHAGTLFSGGGGINNTIVCEHNTFVASDEPGTVLGETYLGHQGMVGSFRSNICWSRVRGPLTFLVHQYSQVPDLISAANVACNLGFNLLPGANGHGYDVHAVGAFGDKDLPFDTDPRFVDPDRNIPTWYRSIRGRSTGSDAGDRAAALAELKKRNDPTGYDPAFSIEALMRYVRAGFAPQNPALKGTAHDGTDVGAVMMAGKVSGGGTRK
ncbi:MAG: hypothetical protein H0W83_05520 [Planctomycetes bacterium]|nr:hypothetical protein [Planctomycetota bacterium]